MPRRQTHCSPPPHRGSKTCSLILPLHPNRNYAYSCHSATFCYKATKCKISLYPSLCVYRSSTVFELSAILVCLKSPPTTSKLILHHTNQTVHHPRWFMPLSSCMPSTVIATLTLRAGPFSIIAIATIAFVLCGPRSQLVVTSRRVWIQNAFEG